MGMVTCGATTRDDFELCERPAHRFLTGSRELNEVRWLRGEVASVSVLVTNGRNRFICLSGETRGHVSALRSARAAGMSSAAWGSQSFLKS